MSLQVLNLLEDDIICRQISIKEGTELTPKEAMKLALKIALQGVGYVSPNPLVGCVIVDKNHRFISSGAHLKIGSAHAEANAILSIPKEKRKQLLKDATIYVTLEPCSHVGKTPPCAELISSYQFREVVYAVLDPNPLVCGKGVNKILASNIKCRQDKNFQKQAQDLAESFFWAQSNNIPFTALKVATDLSGMMARKGDSKFWVSSQRARHYGHYLRLKYDAIAIGANTLIQDNPMLTVRHPKIKGRTPLRVIIDPNARALKKIETENANYFVLSNECEKTLWVIYESYKNDNFTLELIKRNITDKNAQVMFVEQKEQSINLEVFLKKLFLMDIRSLILEGGATLYKNFLEHDLIQKIYLFQSPKLLSSFSYNQELDITEQIEPIFWAKDVRLKNSIDFQQKRLLSFNDDWLIELKKSI